MCRDLMSLGEAVLTLLCAGSVAPSCRSWQRQIWTLCEHEMSLFILHLELIPPDEWKAVSPCVQKPVISTGSDRLRMGTAVCPQTEPELAGCSLLSVCWSSTYLSLCDTASAKAKLAQSTRFSVSTTSIKFPLNVPNSLNWQEKLQLRWKLHLGKEILWDFSFFFPLGCNHENVSRACLHIQYKKFNRGLRLQIKEACLCCTEASAADHTGLPRNTRTNTNKASNRSEPSDGLAISERQIDTPQLQNHSNITRPRCLSCVSFKQWPTKIH